MKFKSAGAQDLNVPAILESATPLASIDSTLWRLEIKSDTLWLPAPKYSLRPDSSNVRGYLLNVPWAEETQYRFVADSAAMTDIYGHVNKLLQTEFKTKSLNDYGNIIFDITDIGQIPRLGSARGGTARQAGQTGENQDRDGQLGDIRLR